MTALVLGGVSLAGGRGSVTGALLGAVNLFLIGYVLATFDFGAIQAFLTQLFYGLILVLSLLLTLLVPIVGRYVCSSRPMRFLSSWESLSPAIMLQVGQPQTSVAASRARPRLLRPAISTRAICCYQCRPPARSVWL